MKIIITILVKQYLILHYYSSSIPNTLFIFLPSKSIPIFFNTEFIIKKWPTTAANQFKPHPPVCRGPSASSSPNGEDISDVEFPATVVFVGGFDPLQDWQRRYYQGLKKRGKEVELMFYPNAIHTFYAYTELDESTALIQKVREFIRSRSLVQ